MINSLSELGTVLGEPFLSYQADGQRTGMVCYWLFIHDKGHTRETKLFDEILELSVYSSHLK